MKSTASAVERRQTVISYIWYFVFYACNIFQHHHMLHKLMTLLGLFFFFLQIANAHFLSKQKIHTTVIISLITSFIKVARHTIKVIYTCNNLQKRITQQYTNITAQVKYDKISLINEIISFIYSFALFCLFKKQQPCFDRHSVAYNTFQNNVGVIKKIDF